MSLEHLKYDHRGVSADKNEVHAAIKHLDKGLYAKAFCKILPDIAAGDPDWCNILHADTAGTKTILAYLYWRETGDLSIWKGVVQDAIVMNTDDMACVGCIDQIILSSTIGRNRKLIPGDAVKAMIDGAGEFIEKMRQHGVQMVLAGGETADVGDLVRTVDIGYTAFARMPKNKLIINDIKAGDVIVGFASYGQTTYEHEYNGGMGSNGLTSARHDVLNKYYAENYPESYDSAIDPKYLYTGSKRMTDGIMVGEHIISVGKLLLSPTRTYLPVLKPILAAYQAQINGIIHNTGGGQTKALKFISQKRIIKDNLFPVPPLFQMIQEESSTDWREMYQVFNMGHRLEIYTNPETAQKLIEIAATFHLEAKIIGRVEESVQNTVEIRSDLGAFEFK